MTEQMPGTELVPTSGTGLIPQSDVLAQAPISTLSELMSRDPLGLGRGDLDRIIGALREQRLRLAKAEGEKPVRQTKAEGGLAAAKQKKTMVSQKSAEELDL